MANALTRRFSLNFQYQSFTNRVASTAHSGSKIPAAATGYGRQWDEDLDKPRLEIMQSRNGELQYRYSVGLLSSGKSSVDPRRVLRTLKDARQYRDRRRESDTDNCVLYARILRAQDEIGAYYAGVLR